MSDPTHRFSDRVADYDRGRPGYPAAVINLLRAELNLAPDDPVADVGAGTGLLAERLAAAGHPTAAVEPNGPMRAAAAARLGRYPNARVVDGTAEATGLADASVALVTAAQAFHWFDADAARREFARVLRSGGGVALLWNARQPDGAFTDAYQAVLDRHAADRTAVEPLVPTAVFDRVFGPGGHRAATVDNPQTLDRDGLLARTFSSSYAPRPDDPRRAALTADVLALFDRHARNGIVTMAQEVRVYLGSVRGWPIVGPTLTGGPMAVVTCPQCGAKNRVDESRAAHDQPKCGRCGTALPAAAGKPVDVTDDTFAAFVADGGGGPVLVDCWAAWCGPCRAIAPTIDALAAESAGRYRVAKLDVDASPRTAAAYRIESIPTLLVFHRGQLVDRMVGGGPKAAIAARLAKLA